MLRWKREERRERRSGLPRHKKKNFMREIYGLCINGEELTIVQYRV
jgi:hypothetical protein